MAPGVAPLARVIDDYYDRVLAIAYQVLGDAGLATRAAELIFARLGRENARMRLDNLVVWRTTADVLRSDIARGYAVAPLASGAAGWQAALVDGLARLLPMDRLLLLLHYHEGLDNLMLAQVLRSDAQAIREQVAQAQSSLSVTPGVSDALR